MKKRIAVYANGWSNEAMRGMVRGMLEYAKTEDTDIFVFVSFASYSEHVNLTQGELNIYKLNGMENYDGVIVFSTLLNSYDTAVNLCTQAKDMGIPVVSIGMEMEGVPSVCVRNEEGMRDLVTHLVEEHGVKNVMFIGGTPDHPDSQARLQVTREVLEEHGLSLGDDQICYGEWGNDVPTMIVDKLVASKKPLPDAIVCANDIMALAVSTEFLKCGYSLPKDVIVTGFDDVYFGRYTYPAITTVKQNHEDIGYRALELIYDQVYNRPHEEKCYVSSSFVKAESCGCTAEGKYEKLRIEYCQRSYERHMTASTLEIVERVLRDKISGISSYMNLKKTLRDHFLRNHSHEGPDYYIVLFSYYYDNPMASEREVWESEDRTKLEEIVSLKNGSIVQGCNVDVKTLVPDYHKEDGKQQVYYFMPLHFYEFNYGYVIMVGDPYLLQEDLLYTYMEKLQQSLKLLRINLRLDTLNKNLTRIYDKDPMTGLFNRLAYENKAIPLFEESIRDMKPMMIMFVDINYMKRINDEFGHDQGDNAIKTVAESIKENVLSTWIPVRFGGDEFLIIAPECDEKRAEKVRKSILEYLDRKNSDGFQPYHISASCGYVVTNPEDSLTLQDYVKEADRLMYEIKQKVHEKDGRPRY